MVATAERQSQRVFNFEIAVSECVVKTVTAKGEVQASRVLKSAILNLDVPSIHFVPLLEFLYFKQEFSLV